MRRVPTRVPASRNDALPYNGAGLILWLDNERFIRMERGAVTRDRRVGAFLLFERHDLGQPVLRKNGFLEEGDVYLKIERRGSHVSGSYSTDGQQWVEAEPISINWPAAKGRARCRQFRVHVAFGPIRGILDPKTERQVGP